jgi:hypothetical protein
MLLTIFIKSSVHPQKKKKKLSEIGSDIWIWKVVNKVIFAEKMQVTSSYQMSTLQKQIDFQLF